MNYADRITRIIVDMYKPNGTKNNVDVYDMSDSFNARVGDEQIPLLIEYRERGIIERMTSESLTPFAMGYVGQPDEHGKVTAETGVAVSYHGSSDDIIGAGKVKMDLPGAMFPQEGMFYGYFGLENSAGKRITSNDVCFEVKNGNPDMYVDSIPFRSELQKLLDLAHALIDKTDGEIKAKLVKWEELVNKMIADGNSDLDTYNERLKTAEDNLALLLKEVKEAGLLTQADLDKSLSEFKIEIKKELDQITEFNNSIKNLNVTDVDGGIPDYMIDTLSSAQAGIDKSKFNLVFATDYHYDIGSTYNPFGGDSVDNMQEMWEAGLRKVLNATSLSNADAVVFNGDNVDEPSVHDHKLEKRMMMKEMKDFFKTASSSTKIPAFILKGNHDQNSHYATDYKNPDSVISDDELEQIYQDNVVDFGEVRNGKSNYFYKDFPEKKIRLIGLDSYDLPEGANEDGTLKFNRFLISGFQQAQLNWLANTALQVTEGTTVVIAMHHPVDGTLASDPRVVNHDVLFQILSDFAEGKTNSVSGKNSDVPVNVNYTFSGAGTIAAVLSGHYHIDGNNTMNGINFIQTRCSLTVGDNMINKKRWAYFGTQLEDAFDVVSIDTTAKTVDLKRVGAGSEDARFATRHFNY